MHSSLSAKRAIIATSRYEANAMSELLSVRCSIAPNSRRTSKPSRLTFFRLVTPLAVLFPYSRSLLRGTKIQFRRFLRYHNVAASGHSRAAVMGRSKTASCLMTLFFIGSPTLSRPWTFSFCAIPIRGQLQQPYKRSELSRI
jgi:hypothetical protein